MSIILPALRPDSCDLKAWLKEDGLDRLGAWLDAVCARESCVNSLPPPDELRESFSAMVERMKGMQAAGK